MFHVIRALFTLLLLSSAVHAERIMPDTPAGEWMIDFVEMFNQADGRAAEQFGRQRLTSSFVEQTFGDLDTALVELAKLRMEFGPLELTQAESTSPLALTAIARGQLTERWVSFAVQIDPGEPARVESLVIGGAAPTRDYVDAAHADDLERELDAYLTNLAERELFSGVVVIERNDVRLFEGAYGRRTEAGDPLTLDARFPLASMSKTFTALAVAQLVEAGLLDFAAPVAAYLPELPGELVDGVTVGHLLSHTSGLGGFDFSLLDGEMRVVDMLALETDRAPWPAGERFRYSNMGFILLGAVIERVTGRDYFDVITTEVLQPLGMTRTAALPLDESTSGFATGFVVDAEAWRSSGRLRLKSNRPQRVPRATPAGDYLSTANDLLAFARGLRRGEVVSTAMLETLVEPRGGEHYGYGFQLFPNGLVGHGGGAPGEDTHFAMDLERGLTIVVLANYDRSAASVVRHIDRLLGLD